MRVVLLNSGGELDSEPVADADTDAVKEALERLVERVAFFAEGDTIRVVEV